MIELPPASLICFSVFFAEAHDLEKIQAELRNTDKILHIKPKLQYLEIGIALGSKIVRMRLYERHMHIIHCKSLNEVNDIIDIFIDTLNVQFDITEIKEVSVIHKYKVPFSIDMNKFSDGEFTSSLGKMKIVKLQNSGDKRSHTSFLINGQNVTQTSLNSLIAYDAFHKFMDKISA